MELRCPSRIHCVLRDDGRLEFKCASKHCGAGGGVTVFHYFDPLTGELVETKTFQDPSKLFNKKEEGQWPSPTPLSRLA